MSTIMEKLTPQQQEESEVLLPESVPPLPSKATVLDPEPAYQKNLSSEWTADGTPFRGPDGVLGEPLPRSRWTSGLFSCFGRHDNFCSSDLEVCLLGSFAPCVLYGSNAERLSSSTRTFANHCLTYTGLYFLGNSLFGGNILSPCLSYHSRTFVRRMFNLEGTCESLSRSCGCCGSIIEDEEQREKWETTCDFATHFFCHLCALCQEGREVRRRLPHPGFRSRYLMVMAPPEEQTMMGRDG